MAPPKVVILMADYGNDPTETAIPFTVFCDEAGFEVCFATEKGKVPECDERMLKGVTQKLLGAAKPAIEQHEAMIHREQFQKPLSWTSPSFSLTAFDLVFLPGGHDKGMQQYITSTSLHKHLAEYMPLTAHSSNSRKACAAICHGVQVLAAADNSDGKSVIHDFETTSLTGFMERSAFWGTRLFLGDYYKTFGYGTDDVEDIVRKRLDDPEKQYKNGGSMSTPFVHKDPNYNYVSGRYPPDADLLAKETVKLVQSLVQ